MQVGDLVRGSKDTSVSASVGVVVENRRPVFGKRNQWVKVFFSSELGKKFSPVDGIFLIREDHLEVINESR